MIRKLKGFTNQLSRWARTKEELLSVIELLKKGTYIIKERKATILDGNEYAIFINYAAYQMQSSAITSFPEKRRL